MPLGLSTAIQLASLTAKAGAIHDGFNHVKDKMSETVDIDVDNPKTLNGQDTVVIVATPAELSEYQQYFEVKNAWLKSIVSSGYNEAAFDIGVQFGSGCQQKRFEQLTGKVGIYQKLKGWFAKKVQDCEIYVTNIYNPKMLKEILTFNSAHFHNENLRLITKILENLYHDYIAYYEWLAVGEKPKNLKTDNEYKGCYYDKQNKIWIIHDNTLWKTAIIVTHLVQIIVAPNVPCKNSREVIRSAFGGASVVPITLYHLHFMNEFLQQKWGKAELQQDIKSKRKKLSEDTDRILTRLSTGESKKGKYIKKMAKYVQSDDFKVSDSDVSDILNVQALSVVSTLIQNEKDANGIGMFDDYEGANDFNRFTELMSASKTELAQAKKHHQKCMKALKEMRDNAGQIDLYVDKKSVNFFKADKKTVMSEYYKLHNFEGHLRSLQSYVTSIETFYRKNMHTEQLSLVCTDRSLEKIIKNLPFELAALIFPNYPSVSSGIFITTGKERFFNEMFQSSFEYLMMDEHQLGKDGIKRLDKFRSEVDALTIRFKVGDDKFEKHLIVYTTINGKEFPLEIELDNYGALSDQIAIIVKEEFSVEQLARLLYSTEEFGPGDKSRAMTMREVVRDNPEVMASLQAFFKEIEVRYLQEHEVISMDNDLNYRDVCFNKINKFINEYIFGMNQSHINKVESLTKDMFCASYPEQMPLLEMLFRPRLGVTNHFMKFGMFDTIVYWQLSHSMLFYATQKIFEELRVTTSSNEGSQAVQDDELKKYVLATLGDYTTTGLDEDVFTVEKKELVNELMKLRGPGKDFRFLISLSVACIMTEFDIMIKLYLVQKALQQLISLYGNEFIRTSTFKEIFTNFDRVLGEVNEKLPKIVKTLSKSVNIWRQELSSDSKREQIYTNSAMALRKIRSYTQHLSEFRDLIANTKKIVDNFPKGKKFGQADGYVEFCDKLSKSNMGDKQRVYSPQIDATQKEFYDESVIQVSNNMKAKRYGQFKQSMTTYLEHAIYTIQYLRASSYPSPGCSQNRKVNNDAVKPDIVAMLIEKSVTIISLDTIIEDDDYPCTFTNRDVGEKNARKVRAKQVIARYDNYTQNSADMVITFLKIFLSVEDPELKNSLFLSEICSFSITSKKAQHIKELFDEFFHKMMAAFALKNNMSLYRTKTVGNDKDETTKEYKVYNSELITVLKHVGAAAKFFAMYTSKAKYNFGEYLTKFFEVLLNADIDARDENIQYYTVACEIVHEVMDLYARIAVNLRSLTRKEYCTNDEGDADPVQVWVDKTFETFSIVDIPGKSTKKGSKITGLYQAKSNIFRASQIIPCISLHERSDVPSNKQKKLMVPSQHTKDIVVEQLQEELFKVQEDFLKLISLFSENSLYKARGWQYTSNTFSKSHRKLAIYSTVTGTTKLPHLITRQKAGGDRPVPIFLDVLTNKASNYLPDLKRYAKNNNKYKTITLANAIDEKKAKHSIYTGDGNRLLKGTLSLERVNATVEFMSFGGFNKDGLDVQTQSGIIAHESTRKAENSTRSSSDNVMKASAKAYRELLILGDLQLLFVNALMTAMNYDSFKQCIVDYTSYGMFEISISKDFATGKGHETANTNPNVSEFYPDRFEDLTRMDNIIYMSNY